MSERSRNAFTIRLPGVFSLPPKQARIPLDSWTQWLECRPCLGTNLPTEVSLSANAHCGRVIRKNGRCYTSYVFQESFEDVAPHPGYPPLGYREPGSAISIFSDGTGGPFDPRFIPQVYDQDRPWIVFHPLPRWYSSSPLVPMRMRRPIEFFQFQNQWDPSPEGDWNEKDITVALKEREEVENRLGSLIENPVAERLLERYQKTLPSFDPLEMRHVKHWRDWLDGRDDLAYSLLYLAELLALERWLILASADGKDLGLEANYIGCWAGSLTDPFEWSNLVQAQVPIYLLVEVPANHPLTLLAKEGDFDNDECLRTDAFDHRFYRPDASKTNRRNGVLFHFSYPTILAPKFPGPVPDNIFTPAHSLFLDDALHPYMPFYSYPFLKNDVRRGIPPLPPAQQKAKVKEQKLFTVFPSGRSLSLVKDYHPILDVIPDTAERRDRYYEEREKNGLFWPQEVLGKVARNRVASACSYKFEWARLRITVYSRFPFPDRENSFARQTTEESEGSGDEEEDDLMEWKAASSPSKVARVYCQREPLDDPLAMTGIDNSPTVLARLPSTSQGYGPIRNSQRKELFSPLASTRLIIDRSPLPERKDFVDAPLARENTSNSSNARNPPRSSPSGQQMEAFEEEDADIEETPKLSLLQRIGARRMTAEEEYASRLFASKSELNKSQRVSEFTFEGIKCFPVRIVNLTNGTTAEDFATFASREDVGWGRVVLASAREEPDGSCTMDVGWSRLDDALHMWSRSGLIVDSKALRIFPVSKMWLPVTHYEFEDEWEDSVTNRIEELQKLHSLESFLLDSAGVEELRLQILQCLDELKQASRSLPLEESIDANDLPGKTALLKDASRSRSLISRILGEVKPVAAVSDKMNSKQRYKARTKCVNRMQAKRNGWKMPGLILPEIPALPNSMDAAAPVVWNWYEECLTKIGSHPLPEGTPPATVQAFINMKLAFGEKGRFPLALTGSAGKPARRKSYNAPFRSPVSKVLSTLKRQLQSPRFLSRDKAAEAAKKEDLEDYVEQSQGEESDENSIVRTQVYLDLDIICHLLRTADKSTERWLLDLCFQKLPNLNHLEDRYPSAFHSRDIIIETYNFLIQGCINRRAGMINPERLARARQLCEFISWYLCLPQTEDEWKKISQTLDRKGDSTLLATLLAKDEGYPNILAALTALGHLTHFQRRNSRYKCSVCSTETSEVALDRTGDQSIEPQEGRMRRLLSLLIMRTDCMLLGHRNGSIPEGSVEDECQDSRKAIQQALPQSGLTEKDKKLWIQALSERELKASLSLKKAWFTPLSMTLSGLQPTRSASLRPSGNAPGRDNASLRPPAAPYLHPGTSSNSPDTHATDSPHAPVDTPLTIPTILLSRPSLVL